MAAPLIGPIRQAPFRSRLVILIQLAASNSRTEWRAWLSDALGWRSSHLRLHPDIRPHEGRLCYSSKSVHIAVSLDP